MRGWPKAEEYAMAAYLPIGTPVLAWTGARDDAPRWTKTRSEPWKLGAGEWVVLVEGITGGVALSHIERIPAGWVSPERIAELADSFEDSIDWSGGRSNYGDNEAYAACARDLRAIVREEA